MLLFVYFELYRMPKNQFARGIIASKISSQKKVTSSQLPVTR